MEPIYVPLAVKNAAIALGDLLPDFLSGSVTLAYAEHISTMYRRMGIGFMFISGIPDDYFVQLFHSGRAYLHFLENADDDAKATSRSEAFFDAIACGDDDGARAIARASRTTWNPKREYEDDFLYVHFVMGRFYRPADTVASLAVLRRYEAALEGGSDPRLALCRAFLEANPGQFQVALDAVIEWRADTLEDQRDRERLNPEDASTTALVWTQLLAWLRLAEAAGFRTRSAYRFAPDVARLLDRARFPAPDAWRSVASFSDLA